MNAPRALALLAAASACATAPPPAPGPAIAFPAAPQRARVLYRAELRSSAGVERPGFFARLAAVFGEEAAPDTLRAPFAVAFDPAGRLLVSEPDARRVVIIDRDGGRWRTLAGGDAPRLPLGLDAGADGRIYVADGLAALVRVYTPQGRPLASIGAGMLTRPSGLAVDRARRVVWVADTPAHRVVAFDLAGAKLREVGGRGSGPGELNFPSFVAVDAEGRLYVNDTMNFRVAVFAPDGRFERAFGRLGNGSGDMSRSKGVAVDALGRAYVADALFDNFQIFDDRGHLLLFVGGHGSGPGQLSMPAGVAIRGDEIAVADRANGRVELFELVDDPSAGEDAP